MARKPRIHYENAIYHVITRGNNRERVFVNDEEKRKYLSILADYKKRYDFELYAYVIMDNHAHLLIKIKSIPLSKIMQGIQQRFTQYYNRRYQHTGHVFEQRYKAFLCEDESYLMTLLCYIHQNPVRAQIKDGLDYHWSSHQSYYNGLSSLVDIAFILDIFHTKREQSISQYCTLIGAPIKKPDLKNEVKEPCPAPTIKTTKLHLQITWEDLINKILNEEQVSRELLLGKCRIRYVTTARKRLIYYAIENNIMTRQQLASKFTMDASRITRIYHELADKDHENKSICRIPQA